MPLFLPSFYSHTQPTQKLACTHTSLFVFFLFYGRSQHTSIPLVVFYFYDLIPPFTLFSVTTFQAQSQPGLCPSACFFVFKCHFQPITPPTHPTTHPVCPPSPCSHSWSSLLILLLFSSSVSPPAVWQRCSVSRRLPDCQHVSIHQHAHTQYVANSRITFFFFFLIKKASTQTASEAAVLPSSFEMQCIYFFSYYLAARLSKWKIADSHTWFFWRYKWDNVQKDALILMPLFVHEEVLSIFFFFLSPWL